MLKELLNFALQIRERRIHRRAPGIEYNFPLGTQPIKPETNSLADPSFDTIANHGATQRPRNCEPDFGTIALSRTRVKCRKERPGVTAAVIVHSPKILGS